MAALLIATGASGGTGAAWGSPMGDVATLLACGNADEATRAVARLEAARRGGYGLPDEQLGGADAAGAADVTADASAGDAEALESVAYDDLLDALAAARQRYPELEQRIDALVMSWDFCALTAEGERWDLALRDGKVVRRWPARMSPLLGRGFAAWGLLPRRANGRPQWQLAARGSMVESGRGGAQCEERRGLQQTPGGSLPMVPEEMTEVDASCQGPPAAKADGAATARGAHGDRGGGSGGGGTRGKGMATAKKTAEEEEPSEVASATTRDAAAVLPGTISAQLTATAMGTFSTGVGASVVPRRNMFVRAALAWRMATEWELEDASALEPTWSWGVGYDDWRTGTFSLQLNHWGPLRRSGGEAAIQGAIADLGYKVPLPERLGRRMSLRANLSTPLSWSPSASAGVSFKLPAYVFVSLGLSQKLLEDRGPTWSYVVGRSRWKAGTLAVTFANYGPNQLDELRLRGVAMTVSYSWSL